MRHTISACVLGAALCLGPASWAEPPRPKARPAPADIVLNLSQDRVVPERESTTRQQVALYMLQASSFVSMVSLVTGTPVLPGLSR